jgi:uncharacterized protein YegL
MADMPALDPDFDAAWSQQLLNEGVEFAENPEPRCPCVLLLDTSGSMRNDPIRALTEGLTTFRTELLKDPLAKRRVELAIVTFGGDVRVVQEFVTVDNFVVPPLQASGLTPMGTAILKGLDMVEGRKQQYRRNGVVYYRPWIFLITDGSPEGEPPHLFQQAAQRVRAEEAAKRVAFFAVGVQNALMSKLAELCARPPLKLAGLRFVDMFVWLSRSTQQIAHSRIGDQIGLPPVDWGTV